MWSLGSYSAFVPLDVLGVFCSFSPGVSLSVSARYAKALEARSGIFNRMIKEALNRGEVQKEIAEQVKIALARFPRVRG